MKPNNFIFITRESRRDPGARIRCFGFSDKLKKKGLDSSVFSFVDKAGAKSGRDESNFVLKDKLRCMLSGYRMLSSKDRNSVFIINRFNYHSIPAWLISMFKSLPLIFDMDDWEARESRCSKAEYLTRLLAQKSVFCIAASRYLENYLLRYNKNVYYIPTAVDTDVFRPSLPRKDRDFVFSWHGSINRAELIEYIRFAVECFLTLYKKYSFIKFYIAADGIFDKELAGMIKRYNCENIVYKGRVGYRDIPAYLDNIDCGLVPLLDKTRFNLSKSPVKLFEYMAKAKPVVASGVGEACHVIKDGYNGFLAFKKDEFVFNMERLIQNPGLAKKTGTAANDTVKKGYSLDMAGEKLAGIINREIN